MHITLARAGYLQVSPSALFVSRQSGAPLANIIAIYAHHQLAYRDYVAANVLCLDDPIGVSEWYLRDIARRNGYVVCKCTDSARAQRVHRSLQGFDQPPMTSPLWSSGPLRISALPPQPRIPVNDELRASIYGSTLERYGLYLPAETASAIRIAIELNRSQLTRVRVALCRRRVRNHAHSDSLRRTTESRRRDNRAYVARRSLFRIQVRIFFERIRDGGRDDFPSVVSLTSL